MSILFAALVGCSPYATVDGVDGYSADTILVRTADGVVQEDVPSGWTVDAWLVTLRAEGVDAYPNGLIQGADDDDDDSDEGGSFGAYSGWQWHLDAIDYDDRPHSDFADEPDEDNPLAGWTVAVLDSGVRSDVSSLAYSDVEAGYDFVDRDGDPSDEHGHGTHIATTLGGFGGVYGVAPGVTILPVRVLDEDNAGTEADLIAGIDYAVAQGADVINLSLTFSASYTPSPALIASLDAAAAKGVVLVGAAGNDGGDRVLWPAASPNVVAVAASSTDAKGTQTLTDYATTGASVDLLAPGGDLSQDQDGDGYGDGILAEGNGGWLEFQSGSSQATAQVSGAAVLLLDAGAHPEDVAAILQGTSSTAGDDGVASGAGAGLVQVREAVDRLSDKAAPSGDDYYAAIMPFIQVDGWTHRPAALVSVMDAKGAGVPKIEVFGTVSGSSSSIVSCTTDTDGSCVLVGSPAKDSATSAWAIEVNAVVETDSVTGNEILHHPHPAFVMTDQLEVLYGAVANDGGLDGALLAVTWSESTHADLGTVADGVSVWAWGTGLVTNPLGVVFGPDALGDSLSSTHTSLDLDGSGLVTNPLGVIDIRVLSIDGSGLVTNPLGFTEIVLVGIDGTGLVTNPLGFDPVDLVVPSHGSGLVTNPLGFGGPIGLPGSAPLDGGSIAGTYTQDVLDAGGNVTDDGWTVATQLEGSGLF